MAGVMLGDVENFTLELCEAQKQLFSSPVS